MSRSEGQRLMRSAKAPSRAQYWPATQHRLQFSTHNGSKSVLSICSQAASAHLLVLLVKPLHRRPAAQTGRERRHSDTNWSLNVEQLIRREHPQQ